MPALTAAQLEADLAQVEQWVAAFREMADRLEKMGDRHRGKMLSVVLLRASGSLDQAAAALSRELKAERRRAAG